MVLKKLNIKYVAMAESGRMHRAVTSAQKNTLVQIQLAAPHKQKHCVFESHPLHHILYRGSKVYAIAFLT